MESSNLQLLAYGLSIFTLLTIGAKQVFYVIALNKDTNKDRFYNAVFWLVATLIVFVMVIIVFFAVNFSRIRGYQISDSIEHWGQVGDFFGGVLNPVLAFASFVALLYTIKLQSKEMEESRHELSQARIAQQKTVVAAQQNLQQEKDLAEFEAFKSLLINHLDELNKFFYEHSLGVIEDAVLNFRFSNNGTEWQSWELVNDSIQSTYGGLCSSNDAANFWGRVAVAKLLAKSMYAPASRLDMVGEDSLYRYLMRQVSFFCCMASFTRAGKQIATVASNEVLANEIRDYWSMMHINPIDTPKN